MHVMSAFPQCHKLKGSVSWQILVNTITSSFGQLHVNEWTWLTGSACASLRETDQSSPHASVSRMLHARECCGRVIQSRVIPDWPRVGSRERHIVSSWHTPFNVQAWLQSNEFAHTCTVQAFQEMHDSHWTSKISVYLWISPSSWPRSVGIWNYHINTYSTQSTKGKEICTYILYFHSEGLPIWWLTRNKQFIRIRIPALGGTTQPTSQVTL